MSSRPSRERREEGGQVLISEDNPDCKDLSSHAGWPSKCSTDAEFPTIGCHPVQFSLIRACDSPEFPFELLPVLLGVAQPVEEGSFESPDWVAR